MKKISFVIIPLCLLLFSCDYVNPDAEKSKTEKLQLKELKIQNEILRQRNELIQEQNTQLLRIANSLKKITK